MQHGLHGHAGAAPVPSCARLSAPTRSGRQSDSQMPSSESVAVPATMKSLAVSCAPMLSMPHR